MPTLPSKFSRLESEPDCNQSGLKTIKMPNINDNSLPSDYEGLCSNQPIQNQEYPDTPDSGSDQAQPGFRRRDTLNVNGFAPEAPRDETNSDSSSPTIIVSQPGDRDLTGEELFATDQVFFGLP